MVLSPEEMFFRAFRHQAFDVSELSLGSFVVSIDQGNPSYVGVPAFLSRAFRHTSILIRTDKGIESPADLKGKRIGIAEYQLSANVWARALLEDDYGVKPSDIFWVRGGMEQAGRPEKIELKLPADIRIEDAPENRSLNALLAEGEIDGFIGPRTLSCFDDGHADVARLFTDSIAAASEYYRRTGIFPIMHVLGVRSSSWISSMPLAGAFCLTTRSVNLCRISPSLVTPGTNRSWLPVSPYRPVWEGVPHATRGTGSRRPKMNRREPGVT